MKTIRKHGLRSACTQRVRRAEKAGMIHVKLRKEVSKENDAKPECIVGVLQRLKVLAGGTRSDMARFRIASGCPGPRNLHWLSHVLHCLSSHWNPLGQYGRYGTRGDLML